MSAQVASVIARLGVADHLVEERARPRNSPPRWAPRPTLLAGCSPPRSVYGLVTKDAAGRFALTPMGELLRSDVARLGARPRGRVPRPADVGKRSAASPRPSGTPIRLDRYVPAGPWEYYQPASGGGPLVRACHGPGHLDPGRPSLPRPTTCRRRASRIVDVGGSRGTLLAHLLHTRPAAMGVLFDRAEALAEAPAFLAEAGVSERVALVRGRFPA